MENCLVSAGQSQLCRPSYTNNMAAKILKVHVSWLLRKQCVSQGDLIISPADIFSHKCDLQKINHTCGWKLISELDVFSHVFICFHMFSGLPIWFHVVLSVFNINLLVSDAFSKFQHFLDFSEPDLCLVAILYGRLLLSFTIVNFIQDLTWQYNRSIFCLKLIIEYSSLHPVYLYPDQILSIQWKNWYIDFIFTV